MMAESTRGFPATVSRSTRRYGTGRHRERRLLKYGAASAATRRFLRKTARVADTIRPQMDLPHGADIRLRIARLRIAELTNPRGSPRDLRAFRWFWQSENPQSNPQFRWRHRNSPRSIRVLGGSNTLDSVNWQTCAAAARGARVVRGDLNPCRNGILSSADDADRICERRPPIA